jgi:hypothetical protein
MDTRSRRAAAPPAGELAAKLRVTAAALRCATRKELSARFRAVNPATPFDLDRSHKWLQGRARPRGSQLYEDWARVLGTARPAAWLAACTVDAFIEEVVRLLDADPALLRRAALAAGRPAPAAEPEAPALPEGLFACYSLAWSPYFAGQLIRGSLVLGPGARGQPEARYAEAGPEGPVCFVGTALAAPRTLNMLLAAPGMAPVFLCLHRPGVPAAGLCGLLAGSALLAEDQRPTASRFAAIRVPDGAPLAATNRYLPADRASVAADLAALGLAGAAVAEVAAAVCEVVLGARLDDVAAAAQTRLGEAAARLWLGAGGAPSLGAAA